MKKGKHKEESKGISKFLKRIVTLDIIFLVLTFILWILFKLTPGIKALQTAFGILFGLSGLFFTILFIALPFLFIRRGMKYLFNHEGVLLRLIWGYLIIIFVIILLFSQLYAVSSAFDLGYITRGTCHDNFNQDMMKADPLVSNNYFYFSSVTFFTVGYGDICPMGASKFIAIINSLIGHIFTTIVLVIALSSFLEYKKEKDNEEE
jgi:potassium channel LctB